MLTIKIQIITFLDGLIKMFYEEIKIIVKI